MPNNTLEYNEDTVRKFLDICSYGLVAGLGKPIPGECCIEHALCLAMGVENKDNPECVGNEVGQKFKIPLNDCAWSSNQERAKAMAPLGIAQLGSNTLDQVEFRSRVKHKEQLEIIVPSFDWIPEENRIPIHNELQEFLKVEFKLDKIQEKLKNYNNYYYNHYYNYYYNYYYIYNYYIYKYYYNYYYIYNYNDYNYNYNYYKQNLQKILHLSAQIGLKVLQEMNSPGCKYLYLLENFVVREPKII